jgi:hypothetical protein
VRFGARRVTQSRNNVAKSKKPAVDGYALLDALTGCRRTLQLDAGASKISMTTEEDTTQAWNSHVRTQPNPQNGISKR